MTPSVDVRYTVDGKATVLKLQGDPFDICNAVRERLFPLESLPKKDAKFDALMKARRKREQ